MKMRTATFQHSDNQETKVRVVVEEEFTSFSIMDSNADNAVIMQKMKFPPLLLAEAFQFITDVVSEEAKGRLSPFVRGWIGTASDVYQNAKTKGFWEDGVERNNGEMLCLIHSEISEALEALRENNPPDNKIPEFSSVEVELADAVIRIMDLAHARGWDVARAIEAKIKYNASRPHKHGKEF